MDFKVYEVCVFIQFYLLGITAFELSDLYWPHILLESEEITADAGSSVTLFCDGSAPLSWLLPEKLWYFSDEDHAYWKGAIIHVIEVPPKSKNYKYGSKIVLQNVTYPHTGFITCFESNRPFRQDKIYMYIRDETHLFVSTETAVAIHVNSAGNVVIPFRQTAPKISTNIINKNIDYSHTYNPYYGFTYGVLRSEAKLEFECKLLKDGSYSNYNYLVRFGQPLKVNLTKISKKVTYLGEELKLFCETKYKKKINIEWMTPNGFHYEENELFIKNVSTNDQGVYICKIREKLGKRYLLATRDIYVNVIGNFINLTEETGAYEVVVNINKTFMQWSVNVDAFSEPKLYWFNNLNQKISGNSTKYVIEYSRRKAILKIINISIFDSGYYTLTASNTYGSRSLVLFLNVVDKPLVYIDFAGNSEFECKIFANPQPTNVFWDITPCQNEHCINTTADILYKNGFQFIASVHIIDFKNGQLRCSVKNSIGRVESSTSFFTKKVTEGIFFLSFDSVINLTEETNEVLAVLHEKLILSCNWRDPYVSVSEDYSQILWFHNGTELKKEFGISFRRGLLVIEYLTLNNSGIYSCEDKNYDEKSKDITLRVLEPFAPNITDTNLLKDIEAKLPAPMELNCKFYGFLKHSIIWYKDNTPLEPSTRIKMLHQNQTINLTSTEVHDEGYYECVVSNKYGKVSRGAYITFLNNTKFLRAWVLVGVVILIIIPILSAVFVSFLIRHKHKLRREIANFGLVNFETGDLIHINPNLAISEQVDLLPYHYKWEFPIEAVKLGEQIGSGAFGVVMKAEARRIVDGEDFTEVAVKMVKKNTGIYSIRALVSELKIMAYLGYHLNIVNLLGAYTKNLNKGELFVIVEYCCYGNLRNYLLNQRENFVNQVDSETDHINYSIGQSIFKESNLALRKESSCLFSKDNSRKHDTSSEVSASIRNDEKGDTIDKSLCTEILLVWAFQVARGMDFLASRNVLHGDLAARNILLSENNVVKICDFGLSRKIYTNQNYKKKSNSPLPFKWMAIESIRDGIFSVKSDVWSFGIVLWEFFSLGQTPYPGIQVDEHLFHKLESGYRMERPNYAPQQIYQVMLECWNNKPFVRPSFWKLMDSISSLLEEDAKQRYSDLNKSKHRNIKQKLENDIELNQADFDNSLCSSTFNPKNDIEFVPL